MRELLKSKNFKVMLVAVFFVLGIMIYSASTAGQQNVFSSIASFITTPVQKLSALISGGINDLGSDMTDIDLIRAENELLKEKVRLLQSQLVDYETYKQKYDDMRKALNLVNAIVEEEKKEKEENGEPVDNLQKPTLLEATVISRDATDAYGTFIIDKGTFQGVAYLDPVITADGLVGFVSQVGPVSSKVTTILSPATDVGAIDRRTRDGGVLGGDQELAQVGYTKLSYLQRDCDVTLGDLIVTSGLGGIYPKNLIVGEVVEIRAEAQDISLYAVINPTADVIGCTDVYVITSFIGQGAIVDGELAILPPSPSDAE